jgi:hypothetical protein
MTERVALVAHDNAAWCAAVATAHGQPSRVTAELWVCDGPPPRFFPWAVTLRRGHETEAALRAEMAAARPGRVGGIKDSFLAIDLSDLGWSELFRADWLWREPAAEGGTLLDWRRVTTAPGLIAWETAWEGGPQPAGVPRQFPAALLADPHIAFVAGRRDGAIVAGAVLTRTDAVVGVSNVFGTGAASDGGWADLPAVAARTFPGLPLVGYEGGADLEAAVRHGFTPIGPLRVWVPPAG